MNVLLVDDEMAMVRILENAINWKAAGISQVFHAYNTVEARTILQSENIDILVCDIEMPRESGLSLIHSVREQYPQIYVIILTAYPEFDYAKQAISLGVSNYLLKPVASQELLEAIDQAQKAITRFQEERQLKRYAEYRCHNTSSQKQLLKDIYRDLFLEEIKPEEPAIRYQLESLEIPWSMVCNLTLLMFQDITREREPKETRLMRFILQNAAEDLFPEYVVLNMDEYILVILQNIKDYEQIQEICSYYMDTARDQLKCILRGFILAGVSSVRLSGAWELLQGSARYTPLGGDELIWLKHLHHNEGVSEVIFDKEKWCDLLVEMDLERILSWFDEEICRASKTVKMDRKYLMRYRQAFLNSYLKCSTDRNQNRSQCWKEELRLFEDAATSVLNLRNYIEFCINSASHHSDLKKSEAIDIVKRYLESHCCDEINRKALENLVHLNSDYLNRLFKAETGYSLMKYVQMCRIELATQYLENTRESIGEIAIKVGYDSPAYFSRIYKKATGISPQQFRDREGLDEAE